ncbi:DNA binding domain-containing protein, excisionase family [Ruminococcus flavefaciens]|uniref:DNA binding domain-containing protein, excisionase family n=1 Tax=Ruminococcus flavefaciens TaxID=1265 RepID=A0A1H6INB4_RUMFL|nr:helix-turn-helix domain-containing protein [Ruminococcus flavefaciens]SEH48515.1 DNA binding domain-containing protein, excisionase family [Ruminococcus flavefaciens]
MKKSDLCLSAVEVSLKTGLSLSFVRKLTRYGKIPHIRVGRRILYPSNALDDWLTQNTSGSLNPKKECGLNG